MNATTMSKRLRRGALVAMAMVMAVGGVGVLQGVPAEAKKPTAKSICGSAYHFVGKQSKGPGTLYYMRKGDTQTRCIVLISKGKAYGVSKPMMVRIGELKDSGNYKYYAGPLYSHGTSGNVAKGKITYKKKTTKYRLSYVFCGQCG